MPSASPAFDLPFFDDHHRLLATDVERFVTESIEPHAPEADTGDSNARGRDFLAALAAHGFLRFLVPLAFGGVQDALDLRSLCVIREALAASSAVADSVFAVHGLGTYPLGRFGSDEVKSEYLPSSAAGTRIGAFALTEPEAGSDLGGITTEARQEGSDYVINGHKTFISNAGIADFYVVFVRTDPQDRKRGLTALLVDANASGLRVSQTLQLIAPHPIGELMFTDCHVPATRRLGNEGDGLRIALSTLDFFRTSVGAAACGLSHRALREALSRAKSRRQFGSRIGDFQAIRFFLADMATLLDAARLLVYRAAWCKDRGEERITRESSMAKLFATEAAQQIVDRAVQIHGGVGVQRGSVVERLYREVRALRIYEGTSEVQHLVIAEQLLKES